MKGLNPVSALLASTLLIGSSALSVQAKDVTPKGYNTPIPEDVLTPDVVRTRIGTFRYFDGFPDDATKKAARRQVDRRDGTVGRRRSRRVDLGERRGAADAEAVVAQTQRRGVAVAHRQLECRRLQHVEVRMRRRGRRQLLQDLVVRGEEGDGQGAAVDVQRARGVVLKVGVVEPARNI